MMPVAVMTQALFVQASRALRVRKLLWIQAVFQNLRERHGMTTITPNSNPRDENPLQPDGTNSSDNLMEPFPVTI